MTQYRVTLLRGDDMFTVAVEADNTAEAAAIAVDEAHADTGKHGWKLDEVDAIRQVDGLEISA